MTREEHKELMKFTMSQTTESVNEIFNTGAFNEIVKGYLIMTLKNLDYSQADIDSAIDELRYMLDMHTAGEARKVV